MNTENYLGATYQGDGTTLFRVWAPLHHRVDVRIVSPEDRIIRMEPEKAGYFSARVEGVEPGALYFYRLAGSVDRPDPASHSQPQGAHGPSEVIDQSHPWEDDDWKGILLHDYIIYEIHVGTFTPEGTFDAIIPRLGELKDLGITSIEIMPVAQFPGDRNWGYDGVSQFAVQSSYGGPIAFKRLVNACHQHGLSVTLDVVYNHFGPEGNYLREFGPYFTDRYLTPWGEALNYDGEHNDEVRNFFIQNALYWLSVFHVDALRLDAVHAIYDRSAIPFLQELAANIEKLRKKTGAFKYLIAESDLNDSRLLRSPQSWGYGLDSQWMDDFHHSLHTLLTGEHQGYYTDYGTIGHFARSLREGYVYSGQYSTFRKRRHGNYAGDLQPSQFVVAIQNHDQIGNRMLGDRLSTMLTFEAQKLAAGALILSPYIPLLFMGQEYGEEAPFLYFVSHSDQSLIEAIRKGRKEEFKDFKWAEEPPDPVGVETYEKSKLNWAKRARGSGRALLEFHKTLIGYRREVVALSVLGRDHIEVREFEDRLSLAVCRWWQESEALCLLNFSSAQATLLPSELDLAGTWHKLLDSADGLWEGPGSLLPDQLNAESSLTLHPQSIAVFLKQSQTELKP